MFGFRSGDRVDLVQTLGFKDGDIDAFEFLDVVPALDGWLRRGR